MTKNNLESDNRHFINSTEIVVTLIRIPRVEHSTSRCSQSTSPSLTISQSCCSQQDTRRNLYE